MDKNKTLLILKYLRGILFFFGLPALVFIVAGTVRWWQAWVYIGISYAASITSRALITKIHPDLLQERLHYSEKADAKKWDKILMPFVAMICPAAYFLVAALDKRLGWSSPMPLWAYLAALLITLTFYAISSWALVENRFFSAVVRIQADRGQTVVDSGPYHYLRHPGYLAGMVVALAFPMMMNTWWAYIPVGIMCVLIIVRTALEDKTLNNELPGYAEYSQKTKFRLLPGIW
jgi:protein-S-isoprenylcysteine O-methyltransferase Ste14